MGIVAATNNDKKSPIDQITPQNLLNSSGQHGGIVGDLLHDGLISEDQVQVAMEELKNSNESDISVVKILVRMGFVSESTLLKITTRGQNVEYVDLASMALQQELVRKIPRQFATRYKVVVIDVKDDSVTIVTDDVSNIIVLDKIKRLFDNKKVIAKYCNAESILKTIEKYYQYSLKISDIIAEIEKESGDKEIDTASFSQNSQGYKNPIVRLVDAIIMDAIQIEASDIHIEPDEYFVRVRIRIDGSLINRLSFHNKYWEWVLGRVKVMSGLNLAESRRPQDGSMSMTVNGKQIDFRISTMPTVHGENIVMRILDSNHSVVPLAQLGFSENNIRLSKLSLEKPEGIIVITGPTGSGKTTTLYSMIDGINTPDINIMTLEDPVEYTLPIIRQTAINYKAGLDFASGLRAILRQDPDVIFIGEIRDFETADIAVKSSLTGHKVFSTLHTNDSVGAIYRLVDMGIKPMLIGSSLNAIIAQRLVRKLCVHCRVEKKSTPKFTHIANAMINADANGYTLYDANHIGCLKCMHTGYKGRLAIVEIIYVDPEMASLITNIADSRTIITSARKNGFTMMCEDGVIKVLQGLTSIPELRGNVDTTSIFGGIPNDDLFVDI